MKAQAACIIAMSFFALPEIASAHTLTINPASSGITLAKIKSDGLTWITLRNFPPSAMTTRLASPDIDKAPSSVLWIEDGGHHKYVVSLPNRDLAGDVRIDLGNPHNLFDYQDRRQSTVVPVALIRNGQTLANLVAARLDDRARDAWSGECSFGGASWTSTKYLSCHFGKLDFAGKGNGLSMPIVGGVLATDGSTPEQYAADANYKFSAGGAIYFNLAIWNGRRAAWFNGGGLALGYMSGTGQFDLSVTR